MELLRLPIELGQSIIDTLIQGLGLYECVKLRCVCKAFDRLIVDTISRGKHVDFKNHWQLHTSRARISPLFLTKILRIRLERDSERRTQLSSIIYGTVDLLSGDVGRLRAYELIDALLEDMGRHCDGRNALHLSSSLGKPSCWSPRDEMHAALIAATAIGDIPAMKRMLAGLSGGYPDAPRFFGWALDIAAFRGQVKAIRFLLRIDLSLYYSPRFLESNNHVFESACYAGRTEVVKLALRKNFGSRPQMIEKKRFILQAIRGHQTALVLSLLEHPDFNWYNRDMFFKAAAKCGCHEVISAMLESEVYVEDYILAPSLKLASGGGHLQAVSVLLGSRRITERCLSDALIMAAMRDRFQVVQLLLDRGADINCASEKIEDRDWDIGTPVSVAALNNRPNMVKYLLGGGADVNAYNQGSKALQFACQFGLEQIVTLLIGAGVDPDFTWNYKYGLKLKPIETAMVSGSEEVASLLHRLGAKDVGNMKFDIVYFRSISDMTPNKRINLSRVLSGRHVLMVPLSLVDAVIRKERERNMQMDRVTQHELNEHENLH